MRDLLSASPEYAYPSFATKIATLSLGKTLKQVFNRIPGTSKLTHISHADPV